jgi:hypothetical protein
VPSEIAFQGILTDTDGKPVDAAETVGFELYDKDTDGTKLWEEQQDVTIEGGLLNVLLGVKNPVNPLLFKGDKLYLEVKIKGESLLPRLEINSTAYSFTAQTALNVPTKEDVETWIKDEGYVKSGTCADGQILKWETDKWICSADTAGSLTAGYGIAISETGEISIKDETVQASAKMVCYDLKEELTTALDDVYAPLSHNHNDAYSFKTHNHDEIYYDKMQIDSKFSGYAAAGHNHDGVYSFSTHNHDDIYSKQGHNHDDLYAGLIHNHDDFYYPKKDMDGILTGFSPAGHNHDSFYSMLGHNHDDLYFTKNEIETALLNYSLADHNHDDFYSAKGHNHDSDYISSEQGTVNTINLADNSVTTAKIENGTILFEDLNDNGCNPGWVIKKKDSGWECSEDLDAKGTVTQINTQAPLTGGPITLTGTVQIDKATGSADGYLSKEDFSAFSGKQNRVNGLCDAGQAIREIKSDGSVECESDNDTIYTNGTGLDLTDHEFSLKSEYADGSVYDSRFVNTTGDTVTGSLIVNGNTGIGTASPSARLEVSGTVKATSFEGNGSSLSNITAVNSDKLDNYHASAFSLEGHDHDTDYINDNSGEINSASDFGFTAVTFIPNLNADKLDNYDASSFAKGSGAAKYVALWSASDTIGAGTIYEEGTNIGIGTTVPSAKLEVSGTVKANSFQGNGSNITSVNADKIDGVHAYTVASPNALLALDSSGLLPTGITGNAATVTNGVYSNVPYDDPYYVNTLSASKINGNITGNAANVTGTVQIDHGGTGATTVTTARTNLGLGALATMDTVSGGTGGTIVDGTIENSDLKSGAFSKITGVGTLGSLSVSGNVGIGVTGAGASLHIVKSGTWAGVAIDNQNTTAGNEAVTFYSNNVQNALMYYDNSAEKLSITNTKPGSLALGTNNAEKFFIDSAGNVGIGTSSPQKHLQIEGSTPDPAVRIKDSGETGDHHLDVYQAYNSYIMATHGLNFDINGESQGDALAIKIDGNVGIGTTNPSQKLHVMGNVQADSFICNSSKNLKKDIRELSQEEYERILKSIKELGLYHFRYKTEPDNQKPHLGLIAEYSPAQILSENGKGVSLSDYINFLTAGIKVLADENSRISKENDMLKKEIESIREDIQYLKSQGL